VHIKASSAATYFVFTNGLFETQVQPNPSFVHEAYFVLQEWAF
jgi:hypothetical protein